MRALTLAFAAFVLAGCAEPDLAPEPPLAPPQAGAATAVGAMTPGQPVSADGLRATMGQPTTARALRDTHAARFAEGIGFHARRAHGVDAIQASRLSLSPIELDAFDRRG